MTHVVRGLLANTKVMLGYWRQEKEREREKERKKERERLVHCYTGEGVHEGKWS